MYEREANSVRKKETSGKWERIVNVCACMCMKAQECEWGQLNEKAKASDLLNQPSTLVHTIWFTTMCKLIAVKTMRNNLTSDFPLDIKGVCWIENCDLSFHSFVHSFISFYCVQFSFRALVFILILPLIVKCVSDDFLEKCEMYQECGVSMPSIVDKWISSEYFFSSPLSQLCTVLFFFRVSYITVWHCSYSHTMSPYISLSLCSDSLVVCQKKAYN